MCATLGYYPYPMYEIIDFNIIMLHFVLFPNVTCYTYSLLSRIHVNTIELCKITCTLVATSVILWSLECIPMCYVKCLDENNFHLRNYYIDE